MILKSRSVYSQAAIMLKVIVVLVLFGAMLRFDWKIAVVTGVVLAMFVVFGDRERDAEKKPED